MRPNLRSIPQTGPLTAKPSAFVIENFSAWFDQHCAVSQLNVEIPAREITCIAGPSGSGKSTILRSLNRINETVEGFRTEGSIKIEDSDLIDDYPDLTELRSKVGMVFQKPCVFPRSIRENVLFGIRGEKLNSAERSKIVMESLCSVALWTEVEHRLDQPATSLSLGQQQRLCIARTLAVNPDILLLDEPTASVDPVSARAIEDLVLSLKKHFTIIMVTHNIQQAKRIADNLLFVCNGQLIEGGPKDFMFSCSAKEKTRTFLNEDFCAC
ncbi:UNVERIFIED_CONTAM: hypothetical protein GTU68_037416 [Idotea baltica]|nr:hypothetical protein [Idotea baltica]